MARTTSLMVDPSMLALICFISARLNTVASNILWGETGWLNRVSGTCRILPPSEDRDLTRVLKIAGENRSRVPAIFTGDCRLLTSARFTTVTAEGDSTGSADHSGNSM